VMVGESFGKGYQDEVGEIEEAEVNEGEDLIELQSARTTVMGVGNYSVPIDIVKHLSVRSIEAFRPLSTMWHRFLGLEAGEGAREEGWVGGGGGSLGRAKKRRACSGDGRANDEALALRRRESRVQDNRDEAVQKAMQQVLGEEKVGFRSAEQEQALHAVLDGQTPLVVVLLGATTTYRNECYPS